MLMISPFLSLRCDGRGLPNTIAGSAMGVDPIMRKSMSPPPSRIAAPAAARSSYSATPGFAHAAQLLLTVDHDQFVHEAFGEDELSVGQRPVQHIKLVDRQIIGVPRIDLDEPDAAPLEL